MTAAFHNTARLLDYGAVELKRLAGKHAVYGLFLSVGVIGAVFLLIMGIDAVLPQERPVVVPGRAIVVNILPPVTATRCPLPQAEKGGEGRPATPTARDIAAPAVADVPVLSDNFADNIFDTPVSDPFADAALGGGGNEGGFDPSGTIGAQTNTHGGLELGGSTKDREWELYPDVLPQVDMNALRRSVIYPALALRRSDEGKVVVAVTIGASGKILACSVQHSTNDIFNGAALEAVRQSRFTPAMRNGQPVQFTMMIPIEFKMK